MATIIRRSHLDMSSEYVPTSCLGALRQDWVKLERFAVDTHGFTQFAVALAKLAGRDLCLQLARLKDRRPSTRRHCHGGWPGSTPRKFLAEFDTAMVTDRATDDILVARAAKPQIPCHTSLFGKSMQPLVTAIDPKSLDAFVAALGRQAWGDRVARFAALSASQSRVGGNLLQRHCIEVTIERLRRQRLSRQPSVAELWIASYAADAMATIHQLSARGRERWLTVLRTALNGDACLVAPFHLLRTAAMQRARGFAVRFAAIEDGAPFDLLIQRDGVEAELVCDIMSAEEGHGIHRSTWFTLLDCITPDLQLWLRAHPGRYLLKVTLPNGLRTENASDLIPNLSARITAILQDGRRGEDDKTAMLRFDPLMMAAARADDLGLVPRLRQEFGPEAHLAVTTTSDGLFVIAARAGQENDVARSVRRRLDVAAPACLTGTRPGIIAMFIEDTDPTEWRLLRDKLQLEGEIRRFMTHPEAGNVVTVTCSSRLEFFGRPDAETEGELRFRNPAHPAAKNDALAPAILSSHQLR